MIYLFLAVATVGFITLVGDFAQMYLLYMISVLGIIIFKARETTILHLCAGLLCFKMLELTAIFVFPTQADLFPDIAPVWLNNNNFLIHLVFDVCVLLFLIYRPPISRVYLRWLVFPRGKQHTDKELTYSQAEAWLISVMFLYFIVDLAAMAENLIRNMDYLGVDESIAKYFWEWTLIFNLYPPVKNFLNLLELLAIWLSVSPRGGKRSPSPQKIRQVLSGIFSRTQATH